MDEVNGVTQRSVMLNIPNDSQGFLSTDEFNKLSAMEKFKAVKEGRYIDKTSSERARRIGPSVIAYVCITSIFTMLIYVLPFHFPEHHVNNDDFKWLWLLGGIFSFSVIQTFVNWILLLFHNPKVVSPVTAPQFLNSQTMTASTSPKLQFLWNFEVDQVTGLRWRWCERCKSHLPPRGHHCQICDCCILQRDRHCFFTGNCIGFSNQRFFAPFTLYATIACLFILYYSPSFLGVRCRESQVPIWGLFLPPYAVISFLVPGGLSLSDFIILIQIYIVWWGWLLCVFFFIVQMFCNVTGRTTFEIHNSDSLLRPRTGILPLVSFRERMQRVHGDWWVLNFIMPMHWVFSTVQDGIDQSHVVNKVRFDEAQQRRIHGK